jgi:prephenate dehydrogenase
MIFCEGPGNPGPFFINKGRIMIVTIIGLGLIGGSLARDLRRVKFTNHIIGVDTNLQHAEAALHLSLVDEIQPFGEALKSADMVIIAVPVDKTLEVLPEVLSSINESATVVDVGSTKRQIVEKVKNHPRRKNFVPAHPMSGTEDSGPGASVEKLFEGKIVILCDHNDTGPQHLALAEKMFHAIRMEIAYMTSEEQDHSTAFISHLPHAAAFALANAVQSKEKGDIIFDLASGGFRSTVRLAKSSVTMWHPIFVQNSDFMVESLNVYLKHLEEFRDCIRDNDSDRLEKLILHANKIREILDAENSTLLKEEERNVKLYTR